MFNFFEVICIVVPSIILFYGLGQVFYKEMNRKFDDSKGLSLEGMYQADLSSEPIECFHCRAKITWNGPGLIGCIENAWNDKDHKIFSPEHPFQCPECHDKIDSILLPKERVKPWKHPLVKHPYSSEDIKLFAKESWTKYEPEKEQMARKPTVQEIMDEHTDKKKKMATIYKVLVFGAMWFAAALLAYRLSFVPWLDVFTSFWEIIKYVTYYLTRWYALIGLLITLFIFFQWHKQAIKDKIDGLRNIYNTRKRYRKMIRRKESVTEDELKSFVNEVNQKSSSEEVVDKKIKGIDKAIKEFERKVSLHPDLDVTVTEDEIPW